MKFILKIAQDNSPENPRTEYDNISHMVCSHKRYALGDAAPQIDFHKFDSWDHVSKYLVCLYDAAVILPLYLYDHSGITISTTPFSCPWDSGQVGFIYMDRNEVLDNAPNNPKYITKKVIKWATEQLEADVKIYDQYLTGDVYGYIIEDEDEQEIESCWGYYGKEYCQEAGEEALRQLQESSNECTNS